MPHVSLLVVAAMAAAVRAGATPARSSSSLLTTKVPLQLRVLRGGGWSRGGRTPLSWISDEVSSTVQGTSRRPPHTGLVESIAWWSYYVVAITTVAALTLAFDVIAVAAVAAAQMLSSPKRIAPYVRATLGLARARIAWKTKCARLESLLAEQQALAGLAARRDSSAPAARAAKADLKHRVDAAQCECDQARACFEEAKLEAVKARNGW